MILVAVTVVLVSIFGFKYLLGYIDYWKKMSTIPTGPYMSRIPFIGHVPALLASKRKHKCSMMRAAFLAIREKFDEFPEYEKMGIFKVFLGPVPFVVVTSPETAGVMLKRTNLGKSFHYKAFNIFFRGLVDLNGDEYKFHRKLLSPAFDIKILQGLPEIISKRAKEFICLIDKSIEANNGVIDNISIPIIKSSLKTILESAGVDYDVGRFADEDFNDQFVNDFMRMMRFVAARSVQPWLLIDWLSQLSDYGRKGMAATKKLVALFEDLYEVMKETMEKEKNNKLDENQNARKKASYLEIMIRENERNPDLFTKKDVLGEFKTFALAGFDPVSSAQTWILHYLGYRPDIQEKIIEELEEVFGDSDRDASIEDIRKLKYLEAVVKEGLRLTSPIQFFGRDADEDFTFKANDGRDITVPKGAVIAILPTFVHKDPRHWPDPEKFDPQRFLEGNENRHPHAFIAFSGGVRACQGKKYGMIEIMGMFSAIFRKYTIKSINPEGSIRPSPQVSNHPIDPVSVQFFKRK